MRIYFTHCSYKKNFSVREKNIKVTPDKFYTSIRIQRFIKRCKTHKVKWAIFSDKYGIWFPDQKHKWYEKSPNEVTDREFKNLVDHTFSKLKNYNEVYFYGNYRSPRFHPLYRKFFNRLRRKGLNIKLISHLNEIK